MQQALQFVDIKDAAKTKGRSWANIVKKEFEPPAQEGDQEFGFSFNV
jgi:hypothetical protein